MNMLIHAFISFLYWLTVSDICGIIMLFYTMKMYAEKK